MSTPGGDRRVSVIYEGGMWELIFRSSLPGAKAVKARVKAILREIRETGRYEVSVGVPQDYEEALVHLLDKVRENKAKVSYATVLGADFVFDRWQAHAAA